MEDPTRDEMLSHLASVPFAGELRDDVEPAIYWFAANYHGGLWSNLYAALCASPFNPGPLCKGPDTGGAELLYEELVSRYASEG